MYHAPWLFNYLEESSKYGAECSRKVTSRRRVTGADRSLVSATDLQIECARALLETLLETMLRKEKAKFRDRAVQMDNLRGLLGIASAEYKDNEVVWSDEEGKRKD